MCWGRKQRIGHISELEGAYILIVKMCGYRKQINTMILALSKMMRSENEVVK